MDDNQSTAPTPQPEEAAKPTPPSMTFEPPDQPRRHRKKLVFIIAAIIVLLLVGLLALKLTADKKAPVTEDSVAPTPVASSEPETNTTEIADATELKNHDSLSPGVKFKYPDTWKVTETQDNGIRIESPEFTFQTADGTETEGIFRLYIRQGARKPDSTYIGRGVAALDSQKLKYADPALGQLKETNLLFFGLDEPNHFAYLFISGNFALKKGESLGPNYGKEADTYIIGGGYTAADLKEDLATVPVPLDYFQTSKAYEQAIEILKSLKVS